MSQFVKVRDSGGNTLFLNPHPAVSVTETGASRESLLGSGVTVSVVSTAEKIVDQLNDNRN